MYCRQLTYRFTATAGLPAGWDPAAGPGPRPFRCVARCFLAAAVAVLVTCEVRGEIDPGKLIATGPRAGTSQRPPGSPPALRPFFTVPDSAPSAPPAGAPAASDSAPPARPAPPQAARVASEPAPPRKPAAASLRGLHDFLNTSRRPQVPAASGQPPVQAAPVAPREESAPRTKPIARPREQGSVARFAVEDEPAASPQPAPGDRRRAPGQFIQPAGEPRALLDSQPAAPQQRVALPGFSVPQPTAARQPLSPQRQETPPPKPQLQPQQLERQQEPPQPARQPPQRPSTRVVQQPTRVAPPPQRTVRPPADAAGTTSPPLAKFVKPTSAAPAATPSGEDAPAGPPAPREPKILPAAPATSVGPPPLRSFIGAPRRQAPRQPAPGENRDVHPGPSNRPATAIQTDGSSTTTPRPRSPSGREPGEGFENKKVVFEPVQGESASGVGQYVTAASRRLDPQPPAAQPAEDPPGDVQPPAAPAVDTLPGDVQLLPVPGAAGPQPAPGPAREEEGDAAPETISPSDEDDGLVPIKALDINITPPNDGAFPSSPAAPRFRDAGQVMHGMGASRSAAETIFYWDAPALCHRPLYFEDHNLERHGYSVGLFQPALSAAHFFGRVPALPYLVLSQRHRQCTYTLGQHRPGSLAPYVWQLPRPSGLGGVLEATTIVGLIFAIP